MKGLGNAVMVVAVVVFVAAIISRLTMVPLPIVPGGLDAEALLGFTNTCLLIAIVLKLSK